MLTQAQADAEQKAHPEPKPPLGTWKAMYIMVLVVQIILLTAFVVFQNAYA